MRLLEFLRLTEQSHQVVLYHGSDEPDLEEYDLSYAQTAADIYTTPDEEGARCFGKYLYQAIPRSGLRYYNMNPENMGPEEYKVLKEYYDICVQLFEIDPENTSFEEFVDSVTSGLLYQTSGGREQDELMSFIFEQGYNVVIFPDAKCGGGWMESYVFSDPNNLRFKRIPEQASLFDAEGDQDVHPGGFNPAGSFGWSAGYSFSPGEHPGIMPADDRMPVRTKP